LPPPTERRLIRDLAVLSRDRLFGDDALIGIVNVRSRRARRAAWYILSRRFLGPHRCFFRIPGFADRLFTPQAQLDAMSVLIRSDHDCLAYDAISAWPPHGHVSREYIAHLVTGACRSDDRSWPAAKRLAALSGYLGADDLERLLQMWPRLREENMGHVLGVWPRVWGRLAQADRQNVLASLKLKALQHYGSQEVFTAWLPLLSEGEMDRVLDRIWSPADCSDVMPFAQCIAGRLGERATGEVCEHLRKGDAWTQRVALACLEGQLHYVGDEDIDRIIHCMDAEETAADAIDVLTAIASRLDDATVRRLLGMTKSASRNTRLHALDGVPRYAQRVSSDDIEALREMAEDTDRSVAVVATKACASRADLLTSDEAWSLIECACRNRMIDVYRPEFGEDVGMPLGTRLDKGHRDILVERAESGRYVVAAVTGLKCLSGVDLDKCQVTTLKAILQHGHYACRREALRILREVVSCGEPV